MDCEGSPWFAVGDACRVLGLTNVTQATKDFTSDELFRAQFVDGRGQHRLLTSESGLYRLVRRSDKPEPRAFQDWVTRVVLPAIGKDGGYLMGDDKVATGEMSVACACAKQGRPPGVLSGSNYLI